MVLDGFSDDGEIADTATLAGIVVGVCVVVLVIAVAIFIICRWR